MSQVLPNPGTYQAKPFAQLVIYEATSGALCLAVPCSLVGDGWEYRAKHTMVLVKDDGTVKTKNVDTLKKVFGWDGTDPFWLTEQDFGEVMFDVVCEHETYTPEATEENPDPTERTVLKIKWINPLGESGSGARMPEMADRDSVLKKYGQKFRALSGTNKKPSMSNVPTPAATSKPAATATKAKQPEQGELVPSGKPAASGTTSTSKSSGPPSQGKAPPAQTKKAAKTATMQEAWDALCAKKPELDEKETGELWYGKIEENFPGKTNSDLSGEDWAVMKEAFEGLE